MQRSAVLTISEPPRKLGIQGNRKYLTNIQRAESAPARRPDRVVSARVRSAFRRRRDVQSAAPQCPEAAAEDSDADSSSKSQKTGLSLFSTSELEYSAVRRLRLRRRRGGEKTLVDSPAQQVDTLVGNHPEFIKARSEASLKNRISAALENLDLRTASPGGDERTALRTQGVEERKFARTWVYPQHVRICTALGAVIKEELESHLNQSRFEKPRATLLTYLLHFQPSVESMRRTRVVEWLEELPLDFEHEDTGQPAVRADTSSGVYGLPRILESV